MKCENLTLQTSEIPSQIKNAVLKGYRRKKVFVTIVPDDHRTTIQPSEYSGGSRTLTTAYNAISHSPASIPDSCLPSGWPSFKSGEKYPLGGTYLVESGSFRGKTAIPTIIITETAWKNLLSRS